MKVLYTLLVLLILSQLGCGGELPNILTEVEEFDALSGSPYDGPNNIPLVDCAYQSFPIKVKISGGAQGIFPIEYYEKAFRFWEYVVGKPVFVFADDIPAYYSDDTRTFFGGIQVFRAVEGRGNWGTCGYHWHAPLGPNATLEPWEVIAHEFGHSLGLGHSLADKEFCIMNSDSPAWQLPPGEGCDLSAVKAFGL